MVFYSFCRVSTSVSCRVSTVSKRPPFGASGFSAKGSMCCWLFSHNGWNLWTDLNELLLLKRRFSLVSNGLKGILWSYTTKVFKLWRNSLQKRYEKRAEERVFFGVLVAKNKTTFTVQLFTSDCHRFWGLFRTICRRKMSLTLSTEENSQNLEYEFPKVAFWKDLSKVTIWRI